MSDDLRTDAQLSSEDQTDSDDSADTGVDDTGVDDTGLDDTTEEAVIDPAPADAEADAAEEIDTAGSAGSEPDSDPDTDSDTDSEPDDGSLVQLLEQEGDVAADFLEELLDIADLDGDIDLDVENDRASVSIVGGDLSTLVGSDGAVLEALQELTRLAVLRETGQRSRLMLDVAGHRAARRTDLERRAGEVVATVRESGEPEKLPPMTPFERKVVHDAVAAAGLRSESEGEAPQRRVVVLPAS